MKKLLRLAALGFLLSAFVVMAAVSVRADSVDEKISSLEQELNRLKAEQAQARAEQLELKREATAAAAVVPTFSYRPGRGVTIAAADSSWSFNVTYEFMVVMYNHLEGNDRRGATVGDLHFRRNRPYFIFCLNNCFYHMGLGFDMDTGQQGLDPSVQQSQWFRVSFNRINPFLPEVHIGDSISGPYAGALTMGPNDRSSTGSAILESLFDMLSDSDSQRLGRRAIATYWKDIPVGMGDVDFGAEYKMGAGITGSFTGPNQLSDTDRAQLAMQLLAQPFSKSKNFWLRGISTGVTLETDSVDTRSAARGRRLRLRSGFERVGGQTIFDTGATTIGGGNHTHWAAGLGWALGPYFVAVQGEWARYADEREGSIISLHGPRGNAWRIWQQLFVYSPKGFFTGTSATPGAIQIGWAFSRANATCGDSDSGSVLDCNPDPTAQGTKAQRAVAGAPYNSAHLINRELGIYYYIRSQMRVGINWYYWTSSNTPVSVQKNIGCNTRTVFSDSGKECSWHTVNLILNANW